MLQLGSARFAHILNVLRKLDVDCRNCPNISWVQWCGRPVRSCTLGKNEQCAVCWHHKNSIGNWSLTCGTQNNWKWETGQTTLEALEICRCRRGRHHWSDDVATLLQHIACAGNSTVPPLCQRTPARMTVFATLHGAQSCGQGKIE